MEELLSARQVCGALDGLYEAVFSNWPDLKRCPPAIIGVRTRGEVIAQRFCARLADNGVRVDHGVLDVTFYRDDLALRKGAPMVRATEIDFDLDDRHVLLVDDVLHTGRSVRAALDAIMDFGRPRSIRLAVLIDRGGRELPIAADYVGKRLEVPDDRRVQVNLQEIDDRDAVYLVKARKTRPKTPKR